MNQLNDFRAAQAEYADTRAAEALAVSQLQQMLASGQVEAKDENFARSLLNAALSPRGASLNQLKWVDKLVERYTPKPVATPVTIGSVVGVVQLLAKAAANGLKFPKLWLQLGPDRPLRITVAGPNSRAPGFLKLTNGESFGSPDNRYYGQISPQGSLNLSDEGKANSTDLVPLLTRLAAEPAKVAAEFGHLTGHCCFCSKKLTDERSTEVGYGRTCARKFGMPWGEK